MVVSDLRSKVEFIHWWYPADCSIFSGEEQLLDMVEEVTSNVIHINISIVNFCWDLLELASKKIDLWIIYGNHLDGLLSKTKLFLIEFALVTKNTEERTGDAVLSDWTNLRISSFNEDAGRHKLSVETFPLDHQS